MSRGPRTRTRLYLVTRIAWPSERAREARGASLEVSAETPELAALAVARMIGARCAPLQLEVAGTLYIAELAEPAVRTFPPTRKIWKLTTPKTGDAQCFPE